MKIFNCTYILQGNTHKCQMIAESEQEVKDNFKRFSYLNGCILTFCIEDKLSTEKARQYKAVVKMIEGKNEFQTCLN